MKYILLYEKFSVVDEEKIRIDQNDDYVTFYHGKDDIGQLELEFKPSIDFNQDDDESTDQYNSRIKLESEKIKSVIIWGYEIYSIYRGKRLGILCVKKLIEYLPKKYKNLSYIDLYVELDNEIAIKTYNNLGFISMPPTKENTYKKMRYYL